MTAPHDTRGVQLSALEFDVLNEHLALDTVPLVLKVDSPGRTRQERAELVGTAWDALTARGLVGSREPDPEIERALRLLARPDREVDARIWSGGSVRVLAAAQDSAAEGVLVIKRDDALTLRPAAPGGLAREALSVLTGAPAGPGRSVSIPSTALDEAASAAGDDVSRLPQELQRRDVRGDDAQELARMVAAPTATGQFGAAVRNRSARRVRAGHVVGFFDTAQGRYLQLRRSSPSGQPWSTVAPVDERTLLGHVSELLRGVLGETPARW
ncbi:ESX secretion-associated protein EspG [Saccharopolyspora sp. HNM0983]|uniref:ESX secretion-associated protein EspG n=1 Tax=Saccharopolyspora montiporae TaxID=2781240 RepID=A0A929B8I2_9PSEU|nr:ESX secretion-associated protein EspG [Saccharopolyspora sp. HNM0983]MBE9375184.1 ESX secretion-associated protein EspG [Saccharopolyspora sp. HNM0983]